MDRGHLSSGLCPWELITRLKRRHTSGRIWKHWRSDRRCFHASRRTSQGFNAAPHRHAPPHPCFLIGSKFFGPRPPLPRHAPLLLLRRCQLADLSVLNFPVCWNTFILKLRCFFSPLYHLRVFQISSMKIVLNFFSHNMI